jgi:hydrogenase maturation protease
MKALIAGVGNIFLTDDGFGPEVLRQFSGSELPPGFTAVDFGIRGLHLTYELLEGYDVLVIVDAAPRGEAPGTVTLVEVDPAGVGAPEDGPLLDAHGMEPLAILRTLGSLGGRVDRIYVLACEPAVTAEGMGLTPVVAAAVPESVAALRGLVERLAAETRPNVGRTTVEEVST